MLRPSLFAFLFAWASLAWAPEYGKPFPDWWHTGSPPRPSADFKRMDSAAFETWAAAQPDYAKPVVDFIRKNLRVYSQAEFETALANTYKKYLQSKTDSRPVMFVSFHKEADKVKSGVWATGILREKFPQEMRTASFYNLSMEATTAEEWEQFRRVVAEKDYRVVVVDDGIYSGKQLTQPLFQLAQRSKEVDVLVPFSTNGPIARLDGHKGFSAPVHFHREIEIPTVEELLKKVPPSEKALLESAFSGQHTLTAFDHKLPDYFSFPRWLARGYSLTRAKGSGKIVPLDNLEFVKTFGKEGAPPATSFLEDGGEPYKICRKVSESVE